MMMIPKIATIRSPDDPETRVPAAVPLRPSQDENPHLVVPQTMPTWTLRYDDLRFGLEKQVEYEAVDAAAALAIAGHEPIGRRAELFCDGAPIFRLGGEPDGAAAYWVAD